MSNAKTSLLKGRQSTAVAPGPANNENKILLPQNSTANLAQITPQSGSIAYDTDQQKVVFNDGSGFSPINSGTGGVVDIANGGTGETTANDALNALLPSQASNSGKVLQTNGTDSSWVTPAATGANTALSNLTSPTALNQDLTFSTGANATIKTKDEAGVVQTRELLLKTGDQTGLNLRSGHITIKPGDSLSRPGSVFIQGGASGDGAGGAGVFQGGTVELRAGANTGTGNAGHVNLVTGSAEPGHLPGDLNITMGSDGTSFGKVIIQDGSQGTAGDVWTSTNTSGSGAWVTPSSPPITGSINTSAYYDASGNLASNVDSKFDISNFSRSDALNFGGTINSSGEGSYFHGVIGSGATANLGRGALLQGEVLNGATWNSGVGTIIAGRGILSAGDGAIAHGETQSGGVIGAGNDAEASGFADGAIIAASGQASKAMGRASLSGNIQSNGIASFAMGIVSSSNLLANGDISFAMGDASTVDATMGQVFGLGHDNSSYVSMAIGRYSSDAGTAGSWVSTDPLFAAGNGTGTGSRSNALRLDKDGKLTTTAAQKDTSVRIVAAAGSLSARTDHIIIADTAGVSGALSLPPGEDGLMFSFGTAGNGGASYTLTPNGGDLLDVSVTNISFGTATQRIIFKSGTWYAIA